MNKRIHDVRILKKGKEYHIQVKTYSASGRFFLPLPPIASWNTVSIKKSLTSARLERNKLLEDNDLYEVE